MRRGGSVDFLEQRIAVVGELLALALHPRATVVNDQAVVGLQFLHSVSEDIVVGSLIVDHLVDQLLREFIIGSGSDGYIRLFLQRHIRDLFGDALIKRFTFAFLAVCGAELVRFCPVLRGIDDIIVTPILEVVWV